jgi:hypothetical protein
MANNSTTTMISINTAGWKWRRRRPQLLLFTDFFILLSLLFVRAGNFRRFALI